MPESPHPCGVFLCFLVSIVSLTSALSSADMHTFERRQQDPAATACSKLAAKLPGKGFTDGQKEFKSSLGSYFSVLEQEIVPRCIVRPLGADDVSTAMMILKTEFDASVRSNLEPLHFAVRSGGHGYEAVSNTKDGVVLDLSSMKKVIVYKQQNAVVIEPGARWRDVTSRLDGIKMAVPGGRNSDVGVGGLVLGGGISYISPRVGLVCNNVFSYEVVLANGTTVLAARGKNKDLWLALKGGSNNFGIVTKITVEAIPFDKAWGGSIFYSISQATQVLMAFNNAARSKNYDELASGPIVAFSYSGIPALRLFINEAIITNLIYSKPLKWPPCWQDFKDIPRIWSTMRVRSMTQATDELDSYGRKNLRQFQMTTTIKNDFNTLQVAQSYAQEQLPRIHNVKGLIWSFVIQALPVSAMRKGYRDGDRLNVLGLDDRDESLVIVLVVASWKNREDDELVEQVARDVIAGVDNIAKERGTHDRFIHLNYAATGQDPIGSYGEENVKFLQEVSRQYDPDQFFQKGCIGGFKLNGGRLLGDQEMSEC